MIEVYCANCGLITEYSIIPSIRETDGDDFMYTICHKCHSIQPKCLGKGCIDMIELSCPQKENSLCIKILEEKYDK